MNFLISYLLLVLIPGIFIYRSAKRLIADGVDQKDLGDPGMWLIEFLFLGWFGFAFYFYKRRKVLAQYNDAQAVGPQAMAHYEAKLARAEAKGAKAKDMALRPWYKRPGRVTLVVLVAFIVISIASNSSSSKKSNPAASSSNASSTTVAAKTTTSTTAASHATSTTVAAKKATVSSATGIGQVVKDGDFAFVVKSVSCGAQAAAAVNSGGIGETVPSGALECIVTMTVTNDKSQAQTFFDSNQYAYDAKGRQYSADSKGSIYLSGDQDMTQINPGITVTAPVPFQIPAGDTIVKMVLHDSAYSGGVTVRV